MKILKRVFLSFASLLLLIAGSSNPIMAENSSPATEESVVRRNPVYGVGFTNLSPSGTSTDYSVVVASGTVVGGGTHSFTMSHSKTTTLSTGGGAQKAQLFNVTFGFSSSETVSLSQTYAYQCPSSYSSCTVRYYPQYTNYNYDETLFGNYVSSGTASVLTGFTQSVSYNY